MFGSGGSRQHGLRSESSALAASLVALAVPDGDRCADGAAKTSVYDAFRPERHTPHPPDLGPLIGLGFALLEWQALRR